MQEARKRTLYEICKDLSEHPELLRDRGGAQALLNGSVRDTLLSTWGSTLGGNFDEALRGLKEQLKPCGEVFTDVELRRIIGTEIAWLMETQEQERPRGADLEAMRNEFVSEVTFGADPLLDRDSPSKRLMELETYLRAWADFPAFGFGIRALDDATGGILPGEICVLTGAPGTMKTSLALCAVDNFVSRTETGLVYYCSVDMAPREISLRLLERESRIPEVILRGMGERADAELPEIRGAVTRKYNGRLVIRGHEPQRRMTLPDLLRQCLKRQPQLVVIDYFTCLKAKGQSDLEYVENAMPDIVAFAHQYETSFLLLSQMGRTSRGEQAGGRIGGHSKGGGIVEELAHTEIELVQQHVDGDKPMVIAAITKARRGVSGQFFSLGYDGPIKRFDGTAMKMAKATQRKAIFEPVDGFYDTSNGTGGEKR